MRNDKFAYDAAEDKATIKDSKRGVLRSVAAAPLNLVQGLVRTSSSASGTDQVKSLATDLINAESDSLISVYTLSCSAQAIFVDSMDAHLQIVVA